MYLNIKYNSCNNNLQLEVFFCKGKIYKTCTVCFISREEKRIAKKNINNNTIMTTTIESIALQTLSNYIAELISNAKNNNEISVEIYLDLNNNIFSILTFDDLKSIIRIIINKIEKDDDYA
ncbi:6354_t:CDS:2 [Dentiscutata heterogama]|uniref:6354_t:CDS:1 n=1 Tax=Dentiscutata heterogama TaxID=1316150 RepID=A0ACA9K386_9GLOM|nr:6354_t:CDS:2 [Dentiscutata heterogama]